MPSRRGFLSAGAAAGLLGLGTAAGTGSDDTPVGEGADAASARVGSRTDGSRRRDSAAVSFDHFVGTDGSSFTVDGDVTYFSGGNHPQLRLGDAWRSDLVSGFLDAWEAAAPDLNWLRVPAFATGTERNEIPLLTSPGEFNESGFVVLDELVAACGERGIRLVLPLSNYWDWNGGANQYVDWAASAGGKDDFFTDATVRQWYREYVEYVLTRENTVTGVPYREDPTIAVWELMNEPRPPEDESVLTNWVDEMSAFVHSVDDNHLVSAGTGGGEGIELPGWYWDIYELDSVDAWSFHVWADPNHQDEGVSGGRDWIREHTEAAHALSMPAYCGEFGWRVDPDRNAADLEAQFAKRNEAFEAWYEQMDAVDTNGALVWDIRADVEYTLDWNPYAVYPRDQDAVDLVATWSETFAGKPPDPSLEKYTDADGRVDTESLRTAIGDWQAGRIDTGLLRTVIGVWQAS